MQGSERFRQLWELPTRLRGLPHWFKQLKTIQTTQNSQLIWSLCKFSLPETFSHLKMDGWKVSFWVKTRPTFRCERWCHVSFGYENLCWIPRWHSFVSDAAYSSRSVVRMPLCDRVRKARWLAVVARGKSWSENAEHEQMHHKHLGGLLF